MSTRRVIRVTELRALGAAIAFLSVARAGSAQAPAVRDTAFVEADGTRLYLESRGAAAAPGVVLFLHGGPGAGVEGLLGFEAYTGRLLEQRYVVAYLHQRGVLRSPKVPIATQTIATHVADVDRVVRHLRQRFPGKKLVVMGHSWGGFLALLYASRHPEAKLDGIVLLAAPLSLAHNELASYDSALAWARRTRTEAAIKELTALGPPPYGSMDKMAKHRRWAAEAMPDAGFKPDLARILAAGGYPLADSSIDQAGQAIGMAMFPALLAGDLRPSIGRVHVPLLAIAGGRDAIVMAGPMMEDLKDYGGPKRTLVFAASDHFLYMEEPDRLAREVTRFIDGLR